MGDIDKVTVKKIEGISNPSTMVVSDLQEQLWPGRNEFGVVAVMVPASIFPQRRGNNQPITAAIITGGFKMDTKSTTREALALDLETGQSIELQLLKVERRRHAMTRVGNRAFVIGGGNNQPLNTIEWIDLQSEGAKWIEFKPQQNIMPKRYWPVACTFNQSKILIMGGDGGQKHLNDAVIFDPETNEAQKLISSDTKRKEAQLDSAANPVVASDGSIFAIMRYRGKLRQVPNRAIVRFSLDAGPTFDIVRELQVP